MARQSAEDRATRVVVEGSFGQRAEPPAELDSAQAAIWRATVSSEALEFFSTTATRDLLRDYCRHRAEAERISLMINAFEPEWAKTAEGLSRYNRLLTMRERETRAACALATKLRITNQSRFSKQVAATGANNTLRGKKPWEE